MHCQHLLIAVLNATLAGIAPTHAPTKHIVVDHVERIADTDLLAVLLKAKEITGRDDLLVDICTCPRLCFRS